MDEDGARGCTSSLCRAVLQDLLHPDGHVGHILGDSLDSLHQAGWLKPAHNNSTGTRVKWNQSQKPGAVGWGANTLLSHFVSPVQQYMLCLPKHRSDIIKSFILKSLSAN